MFAELLPSTSRATSRPLFSVISLRIGQIWLKFEEETSEMLRLEHGSVWCWNFDAPGNRSETPGKFWNVVLEKDGEVSWSDHVRNEQMLHRVNEQRDILHEIRKREANWIGHILRINCLLQQVIEGKIKGQIEVTRRRRRMRKKLLDDLKDRRGSCQLKEKALDRTMWRNRFGRGFGPVVWQITDDDDDDDDRLQYCGNYF